MPRLKRNQSTFVTRLQLNLLGIWIKILMILSTCSNAHKIAKNNLEVY